MMDEDGEEEEEEDELLPDGEQLELELIAATMELEALQRTTAATTAASGRTTRTCTISSRSS